MAWFTEWRRLRKFTKAWRLACQENFRNGTIDIPAYAKAMTAADRPKVMKMLMSQTETAPGLYGGIKDWDWEAILKWVREFFIPLLQALLPLLLVLDEE